MRTSVDICFKERNILLSFPPLPNYINIARHNLSSDSHTRRK